MRKSLPLVTFVALTLALGLTAVTALRLSAQNPTPRTTAPVAAPAGTNVAVVDIAYVLKHHQRFQATLEDIRKDMSAFEQEMKVAQQTLTDESKKLQAWNPGSTEYQQLEERLVDMKSDLNLRVSRKRKEIVDRDAGAYYNAYKEINDHVAEFANRYNIALVLDFDSDEIDVKDPRAVAQGINRVVVFQNRLNITGDIIAQVNRGTMPASARPTGPQIPRQR